MKKQIIILPFFLTVIILFILYLTVYKDVQILGGLQTGFDSKEIMHRADQLFKDQNVHLDNMQKDINLQANQDLIRQVQSRYGYKKGNELLRSSLPGFFWKVNWNKISKSGVVFGMSNGDSRMDNSSMAKLSYDSHGRLIEYYLVQNDSAEITSLNSKDAYEAANNFISRFFKIEKYKKTNNNPDSINDEHSSLVSASGEKLEFRNVRRIIYPHRTDYLYSWHGKSAFIDDSIRVDVTVSGNIISAYSFSYVVPEKYKDIDSNVFQGIAPIIFYFIIIILIAVIAYKKIKAYEIGFRLAFTVAAIVAIALCIHLYVIINTQMGWFILLPLIFGPAFYGGLVFITWAAGETITREVWNEKFGSADLINKGYILNTKIGESILNGLTAGFGVVIMQILLLFIAENITAVTSSSYSSILSILVNNSSSSTSIISSAIYHPIFLAAIFLLFTVSGLRKRIKSGFLLVLISGIIWGLVNSSEIYPYYINSALDILTGIFLVWIYYKFDLLTSVVSLSAYMLTGMVLSLLYMGNSSFTSSAYLILFLIVLVIIYAFVSIFSGNKAIDFDAVTPTFVKNITERERLQRELEIAKEVQMSFLPRTDPEFPGLEIASRCLPALEVGGDYYDFVPSGDKKIGIIIGDVSGKGTQAAFYMTLTKGFLKALSRFDYTPANFLIELNSLFYENVERGTFISMVYGVLNIENKTLRLARAGHNPVIVKSSAQSKTEFLNSSGLALGLEKGQIFSSAIKEIEIPISTGDVFVFYTDGFTEAMNRLNEEFGEEKLVAAVENNSGLHAKDILNNIFIEVQGFIGKADQHDDMTMVVVKVV
jgi:sigma-B regulation protein RsbU (phosphoserine phosphatase)